MHPFFSFISKIGNDIKNRTSRSIEHLLSYRVEADGVSLAQKNRQWVQHLLKVVEIDSTGYKMNLATEKLIGKARNKKHIVTSKEAFAHIMDIIPTVKNAFLFRKDRGRL